MNNKLSSKFTLLVIAIVFATATQSQTAGTLTFTFTEVPVAIASTYQSTGKHVLAAWIQNTTGTGTGTFVKTKLRFAGGGTADHLPTWAVNAGGVSTNCIAAACNVVDATTGATRSTWNTYTVNWDGKKGAAATGTLQPDGVYKVTLQSTWNHGGTGTATSSYTFTKGPNIDHQTPAGTTTFTNVILHWEPLAPNGLEENTYSNPIVNVSPNPTEGIFNVDFKNANCIKVINTLGIVVHEIKLDVLSDGSEKIDLTHFANGVYFINIANNKGAINHKVIVNK